MESLVLLEERLGYAFNDRSLLLQALTHRSYLNENLSESLEDNERLEFLGDAVLDFIVGDYLFNRFPEMDEGDLTRLRAALVRTGTLAQFARSIELGGALRLGLGEEENDGRNRSAMLCAAFEAVIGATYLDQGLDRIASLIQRLVPPMLAHILEQSLHKDAKSEFQIWAQGSFNITPRYMPHVESGPDHDKRFTVRVMLRNQVWGEGSGHSKQAAAQSAAQVALERAKLLEDSDLGSLFDEVD